jgi:hypothetical protein
MSEREMFHRRYDRRDACIIANYNNAMCGEEARGLGLKGDGGIEQLQKRAGAPFLSVGGLEPFSVPV